jgi:hypothetical protein
MSNEDDIKRVMAVMTKRGFECLFREAGEIEKKSGAHYIVEDCGGGSEASRKGKRCRQ